MEAGCPARPPSSPSPSCWPSATAGCGSCPRRLTIYSGRSQDLIGPLLEQFAEETGINIDVKYGDSADLALLLDEEGDRTPADVFISQSPGADRLPRRARTGSAELPAAVARPGRPRRTAPPTATGSASPAACGCSSTTPSWSTEADLPDSVLDLTDPALRGQGRRRPRPTGRSRTSSPPCASDVGDDADRRRGSKGMAANDSPTYANNIAIVEAVGRGEIPMGLVNHYYNYRSRQEDPGTPSREPLLPRRRPRGPGDPVARPACWPAPTRPTRPSRFVEFLLSDGAQEYFATETFEYPLVDGVEPPPGCRRSTSLRSPDVDLDDSRGGLRDARGADPAEWLPASERRRRSAPPAGAAAGRPRRRLVGRCRRWSPACVRHPAGLPGRPGRCRGRRRSPPGPRPRTLGPLAPDPGPRRSRWPAPRPSSGPPWPGWSTRTDVPGRRVARLLLPLPLVMPSFIAAFALLAAFAPGGLLAGLLEPLGVDRLPAFEGFWGALFVLTLFTYPYVYLPVAARLARCRRRSRRAPGCSARGPAAVFRTVVLPQARQRRVGRGRCWSSSTRSATSGPSSCCATTPHPLHLRQPRLFDRAGVAGPEPAAGAAGRGRGRRPSGRSPAAAARGGWPPAPGPCASPSAAGGRRPSGCVAGVVGLALVAPVGVLACWAGRGLAAGSTRAGALVGERGLAGRPGGQHRRHGAWRRRSSPWPWCCRSPT